MTTRNKLNPFDTVRYDSHFNPNSRTLQTSLLEKFNDAYEVLKGEREFLDQKTKSMSRLGIFDYLTLGLFKLTDYLLDNSNDLFMFYSQQASQAKENNKSTFWPTLLRIPFAISSTALLTIHVAGNYIARPLTAIAITMSSAVMITVVHGITELISRFFSNKLSDRIEITPRDSSSRPVSLDEAIPVDTIRTNPSFSQIPMEDDTHQSMPQFTTTLGSALHDLKLSPAKATISFDNKLNFFSCLSWEMSGRTTEFHMATNTAAVEKLARFNTSIRSIYLQHHDRDQASLEREMQPRHRCPTKVKRF